MGKSEGGGRGRCRSKNKSEAKGKEESGNGRHHGVSDGGSDVERAGGVAGRAGGTERGREGEGVGSGWTQRTTLLSKGSNERNCYCPPSAGYCAIQSEVRSTGR